MPAIILSIAALLSARKGASAVMVAFVGAVACAALGAG